MLHLSPILLWYHPLSYFLFSFLSLSLWIFKGCFPALVHVGLSVGVCVCVSHLFLLDSFCVFLSTVSDLLLLLNHDDLEFRKLFDSPSMDLCTELFGPLESLYLLTVPLCFVKESFLYREKWACLSPSPSLFLGLSYTDPMMLPQLWMPSPCSRSCFQQNLLPSCRIWSQSVGG